MILFTKPDCPLCSVVKVKLNSANISYVISQDEERMEALGINRLPVL
jgi:glutaredoxin